MRLSNTYRGSIRICAAIALSVILTPLAAYAQGSIFGTVQNADLSFPANGQVSFFGYLDDTDEEIRIETSTGAGYDNGNWFDDFQNYLTEAPGNPYDYHFSNAFVSEGFKLSKLIPNNSFQQENILLGPVSWPSQPTGLTGFAVSTNTVEISWSAQTGVTYHVYRRISASNGSLFRLDDPTGSLANPGVSDSFYVDLTVDGISVYDYVIIGENASGNFSQHSAVLTVNSAIITAPVIFSINPNSGVTIGGTTVDIFGDGFDLGGANAIVGGSPLTGITVLSPKHIRGVTAAGSAGPANVFVVNLASALSSNTLVGGFTYTVNNPPVLAPIGAQSAPEGGLLSFTATATDSDGGFPIMAASPLPTGATFVDNGDGTGSFNWPTTFFDAGVYVVLFTATDDLEPLIVDSEQVTITISEAGNQLPVLAAIGAQFTTENTNLNFAFSATDAESTPSLAAIGLPVGATLIDNGDGTGVFDWTPDFLQSGIFNITFIATDDSLAADSELVVITVTDAGNQSPVLAAIGPQSTTETAALNFALSATDAESIPALSAINLPTGALFVDNGDGTGAFDWTPSALQSGIHNVTFIATDDSLVADSEVVVITVSEIGNQAPVLAAIGAQATTENVDLTFGISASDIESIPTLSAVNLPAGAIFTDNADGTGVFNWTPNFLQSGIFSVTFIAVDDSLAADSEIVSITVAEAGNQLPILALIGPQTTTENVNLNFAVSASDIESIPNLTVVGLPAGASFVDNGDGTGLFDWTPTLIQAGVYSVTFNATDDSLAVASEVVTITVLEVGNQAPVLSAIGAQTVNEGLALSFPISATDVESIPVLSAVPVPAGAVLTDNGDGTGSFDWTPTFLQSGVYSITFAANDDSLSVDSEVVTITVVEMGNQLPTLDPIGFKVVAEGTNLAFIVTASDPESTPQLLISGLPTGASYIDNGDGTGAFSWTPSFVQSGDFSVTFFAQDDSLQVVNETITITVLDAGNQTPILAPIGPQTTTENVNLNFTVSATDEESIPTLIATTLPSGASFIDNGDGTGLFDWTPSFLQSGAYSILFTTTDDSTITDTETVSITVIESGNQPPTLAAIGPQTVTEGTLLNIAVLATDAESIPTLSAINLPAGATFVDNGDGSGAFDWTPSPLQSGIFNVTFSATDDSLVVDSEVVVITVSESGNQLPILVPIGPQATTENVNLTFAVSATDIESIPALNAVNLPAGAIFTDNADGTGVFDWTPNFLQSGIFSVTIIAVDDSLAADSEIVSINVAEVGNQLPILAPIGPQATTENVNLNFAISASDIESIPSLTVVGLPGGASFIDNGDGTGLFDWTPTLIQAGTYNVNFIATDDSLALDSEVVTIIVSEVGNQAPVLSAIGSQTVSEGLALSFSVSAADVESIPVLSASPLPAGAVLTDNGDGTGSFDWTPTLIQAGVYSVTFSATDDSLAVDSEVVIITVLEVGNQAPILSAIGAQTVNEGLALSFPISATDVESIPVLSAIPLPAGAVLTDNGDGTGSFDWTPTFLQSGVYSITFAASDDSLSIDSEVVTITVIELGNQLPTLDPIGFKLVTEGTNLAFIVTASDPESTPQLLISGLPNGASYIDNGNGTGAFSWTPLFVQSGDFSVTFFAQDDSLQVVSETITITVLDAGNQPPILAPIGPQTTTENINLNFIVNATDAESIPILIATALPTGASFVDNGDGTGLFNWTPSFLQAGSYSIQFIATDDSTATDTETVAITVIESGNQPPTLAAIGPQTLTEGTLLSIAVSATDAESAVILSTVSLPAGATFIDNGDGTGAFDWTPDFLQSGTFNVTFIAADSALAADSEVVVITVIDAGNQIPALAVIGPQTGIENQLITFAISATDPESIPTLSATGLPLGAAFVDNLNGSGSFTWTPDFLQSGVYNVTFFAADDSLAIDSEIVTVTITDGGNQAPILALIGPQTTTELVNLTFTFSATDIESIPALSASPLPAGATVTDSGNGVAVFSWTPSQIDGGPRSITFFATDDSLLIDSEVVIITVIDVGNQPPLIDSIADITIAEGDSLGFFVTANDVESVPTLIALGLPPGATFTDNLNGSGLFSWIPNFIQAGAYVVTFVATDDSLVTDSETVMITVTEGGNQPPVITAVSDTSVAESGALLLVITAVDPEAAGPVFMSSVSTLSNAVFTDSGNGIATLVYTPDFLDAGVDTFRVFATDAGLPPSTAQFDIIITTIEVNQPPVIDSIPPAAVLVGRDLIFTLVATDTTDPIITNKIALTVVNLPLNATFVDNLNNTGTFNFTPTVAQVGVDTVRFLAIDKGTPPLSDIFDVIITVVDQNNAPVITPIAPRTVDEGATLSFTVTATDSDLDPITLSTRNAPDNSTFVDNGNGTGLFTFDPDFTQGGSSGASLLYSVTFIASDGIDDDRRNALIQVIDAGNKAPVFDSLRDTSFVEGTILTHIIFASDPDGTIPSLTADSLPLNASFVNNGDGSGTITFAPNFVQAGAYTVFINATDGSLTTTSSLVITVLDAGNQPPQMPFDSTQLLRAETDLISFTLTATDPDSTFPIMTATNLPPGATFVDNGGGEGSFVWQTQNLDAGNYNVIFFATDALDPLLFDSAIVNLDVADSNFIPLIFPVQGQTKTVNEGQTLIFVVTASDADGTVPLLSTDTLFPNMSFVDSGNGIGVLSFTPDFTQGSPSPGTPYKVDFIATDAVDPTITKRTSPQNFLVRHVNQPPVITPIASQAVVEGTTLFFTVESSDADLAAPSTTFPVLRAENLPPNATAVNPANGDLTKLEFTFSPDFTQAGTFVISFIASDTQSEDTLLLQIDVVDAGNQAPIWTTVFQDTTLVVAGTFAEFPLNTFEPDNDPVVLSLSFSPSGSALIDSGNGAGSFRYNPDAFDVGAAIPVEFYVSDPAGASDTIQTVFVVRAFLRGDANTDTRIDLTDAVFLIDYIFRNGSEPVSFEAADVDFDGKIRITDVTFLINYLFRQGSPPPE